MIQPGFAAIGPGGAYGNAASYGNNGNGSPQHDDGMGMNPQQQQLQNGMMQQQQQHDVNGQQQQGGVAALQPDYTLAGILHFLQSEWRRYERDRNEWEIERAEMRARVALLEGERRSIENLKTDLMRRVKMLEFALRQERSKYLASGTNSAGAAGGNAGAVNPKYAALQHLDKASSSSGRSSPAHDGAGAANANEQQHAAELRRVASSQSNYSTQGYSTLNTNTLNGTLGTMAGGLGAHLGRQGSNAKDPKARAKSREYLKQCLQEISYLTSTSTLNPLPERAPSSTLPSGNTGHTRPRKTMPENVPAIFAEGAPGSDAMGTLTAAAARRQRGLEPGGAATGKVGGARGVQPFNEPLVERDEETMAGEEEVPSAQEAPSGAHGSQPAVEGLALDRNSMALDKNELGSDSSSVDSGSAGDDALTSSTGHSSQSSPGQGEHDLLTVGYQHSDGPGVNATSAGQHGLSRDEHAVKASQEDQLAATSARIQELMRASTASAAVKGGEDDDLASLTLTGGETHDEASKIADEAAVDSQMWKSKRVLRGHLDSVRAIAFDASELGLYSASDDGTIKYWKLDATGLKQNNRSPAAVAAAAAASGSEADPLATLRGHSGPVTSLALSTSKRRLFSGSVDTSIVAWKLLDVNMTEPYPPYDKSAEVARLVGHTQPVWDVCVLPTNGDEEGLLASASADGTVKIWNIQQETDANEGRLLISFDYFGLEPSGKEEERKELLAKGEGSLPVPTSVVPCMSDLRRCAVSFSNAVVKLFDVQTGKEAMQLPSDTHYDGTQATQVNKVITHPTLPMLITGHEDNYIKFFDINTRACTLSMVAHLDSVTSLDIDPSGLTLVSGGHDCSVRFWDIVSSHSDGEGMGKTAAAANGDGNAAVCVQEITAHRKKSTEGVLVVKYHPNAPWFSSAGADGVIRIYG